MWSAHYMQIQLTTCSIPKELSLVKTRKAEGIFFCQTWTLPAVKSDHLKIGKVKGLSKTNLLVGQLP